MEGTAFDRLVNTLSSDERREMLEKLQVKIQASDEPLSNITETDYIDLEQKYNELSFLEKIILFIQSLFTKKNVLELVEDNIIKNIGKAIETAMPGLIDFKEKTFATSFYTELKDLNDSISFLYEPFSKAFGVEKNEYYAFLASFELEVVHAKLLNDISFSKIDKEERDKSPQQLKQIVESRYELIMDEIQPEDRQRVYNYIKGMNRLFMLSKFPFEKMFNSFCRRGPEIPDPCTIKALKNPLLELCEILFSLNEPPPVKVLESLFLFQYKEKLEDKEFNVENEIGAKIQQAEEALMQIRHFNRRIPLIKIVQYVTRKINYKPEAKGGGEDWFVLYKKFWEKRIKDEFRQYSIEIKHRRLMDDISGFLNVTNVPMLDNYNHEKQSKDFRLRYGGVLSFLNLFVLKIFVMKMNQALKILLFEGEFYKPENKEAFTDVYNLILRIPERVKRLDESLTPVGENGKAFDSIKNEMVPPYVKRKKLENLSTMVDKSAKQILTDSFEAFITLKNILYGILYGVTGGKYDTISNISYIQGANNSKYKKELEVIMNKIETAGNLLQSLYDLENE